MRADDVVLAIRPLGFSWPTVDPFLFCVHHDDAYPNGDERLGPAASLAGRTLGMDFEGKDGWRMYHGDVVPGFPQHPHRGFETVTLARRGFIDHADSLGASARFGRGDVQWMTAGRGVVHSEMFPLLDRERGNPVELFQIWLNLPSKHKLAPPFFTLFWSERIPVVRVGDGRGKATTITVVAGRYGATPPPVPPPHSWAREPDSDVAIWTIAMEPGARFTLSATRSTTLRALYLFTGAPVRVAGHDTPPSSAIFLRGDADVVLHNGDAPAELLLLQGRPIGEPVAQHGPFVMNSAAEIRQAFIDYERTRFGGWPWPTDAPVHPRDAGRFAKYADGHVERPSTTEPMRATE